jgi:hypothetical protein
MQMQPFDGTTGIGKWAVEAAVIFRSGCKRPRCQQTGWVCCHQSRVGPSGKMWLTLLDSIDGCDRRLAFASQEFAVSTSGNLSEGDKRDSKSDMPDPRHGPPSPANPTETGQGTSRRGYFAPEPASRTRPVCVCRESAVVRLLANLF